METAIRTFVVSCLLEAMLAPGVCEADEVEIGEVKVEAKKPSFPPSPGLETASAETVEIDEEADVTWITLEQVLSSTPSVEVRAFGAPGSPSFVSVRGTDATHTLVLLDGVPLNDASTGFVDLSTVPVGLLGQVTVVRGGHHAGAGPYHPGGVVLLETREMEPGIHAGVSLCAGFFPLGPKSGAGSSAGQKLRPMSEIVRFGAMKGLALHMSAFDGTFGVMAAGGYQASTGDFAYLDDQGTVYNVDDDLFSTRTNDDHASGSGLVKLTWLPDWSSEVVLSGLVNVMRDGLPGIDVLMAEIASLSRMRAHLTLDYRRWRDDLMSVPFIEAATYLRLTGLELDDPLGEISLASTSTLSRDLAGGLSAGLHVLVPGGAVMGLDARLGIEGWKSLDRLHPDMDPVRALRLDLGLGLDASAPIWDGRIVMEGSVRASLVHDAMTDGSGRTHPYVSPRAGLRLAPLPWLWIVASAYYTHRPPTFMELFGNGGMFSGSDDLRPEHGPGAEAGLGLELPEGAAGGLELAMSVAGFIKVTSDLIVFIQNSQRTMVATNVSEARIAGIELGAHAGWAGWASVDMGYTLLDPVDRSGIEPYDGAMLPNRPRHDLFVTASLGHFGVLLSWQLDHMGGGFVDRTGIEPISARSIHTLSARWTPAGAPGLSLDLKWYNVGNSIVSTSFITSSTGAIMERRRAITDVDGYPLPGTAIFFTLAFRR